MLNIPAAMQINADACAPSSLYTMKLNGQDCPVRACRVSAMPFNRPWPGHQRPLSQTEEAGYVSFAADEPVTVEVATLLVSDKTPEILPLSARTPVTADKGTIRFTLNRPGQYVLRCGSMHHVLHIFFDPVKTYPESRDATYFFGPGVHCPGLLRLKSGDSVYVDRNAIVFTSILAEHAENIRIYGGGVIDGSSEERITGHCYTPHTKSIRFYFCNDIRIEDVVILNSPNWSISTFCCSDIVIDGVKIAGQWRYNTDGIDLCNSQHAVIQNSFVRSFDDTVVLKGIDYRPFPDLSFVMQKFGSLYDGWDGPVAVEDITVRNCVFWCDWGLTLELGFETSAPEFKNILFEDCDLIHNAAAALDIKNGDYADIHDVTFRNIRVEYQAHNEPAELQTSDDMAYDPSVQAGIPMLIYSGNNRFLEEYSKGYYHAPAEEVARISKTVPWGITRDILYQDIQVFTEPGVPEKLPVGIGSLSEKVSYGPHTIRNLTVNGKPVRRLADVDWRGTEPDAVIFNA